MHSVGEFDVFHLFCFSGVPVAMLMMTVDMDQRETKFKGEIAGRSLDDGTDLPQSPRTHSRMIKKHQPSLYSLKVE